MSFWTYFWLFVPPVILVIIGFVFYAASKSGGQAEDIL